MANKVKYGLKNVHYAVITENNGETTYDTPKPIPGAVNLTLSPRGKEQNSMQMICYITQRAQMTDMRVI